MDPAFLQRYSLKDVMPNILGLSKFCGKYYVIALNAPLILAMVYQIYNHSQKDSSNEKQQDETYEDDSSQRNEDTRDKEQCGDQNRDDAHDKGDDEDSADQYTEQPEASQNDEKVKPVDNQKIEEFKLQVYTPQQAGLDFVKELFNRLKEEVKEEKELMFTMVDSLDKITQGQPLFVICVNNSRLGTDASICVKGINVLSDSKSSVLLVFHHKEEHALPIQPSARLLVDSEFRNVCNIYDVACHKGSGVYPCDMNTKTFSEILGFIRSLYNILH